MKRLNIAVYIGVMILLGIMSSAAQLAPNAQVIYRSAFTVSLSDGTPIVLNFSAAPELFRCRQVTMDEDQQLWHCSDYSLSINVSRGSAVDLVSFVLENPDGIPFNLREHGVSVKVPRAEGDALWSFNRLPKEDIMESNLDRPWQFFSAANNGIPYIALIDSEGRTRLALGLLGQDHAVITRFDPVYGEDSYELTLRQVDNATAEVFSGVYYISRALDPWLSNAQRYTEFVDRERGYTPLPRPEAALNPTYDTWYWTHDRIDQKLLHDMAERSSALGFKTFLIDAGWDTRAGEYVKGLRGSTGDYIPPPKAFPDFVALLDDIRGRLGMKVMLWMQQYNLGRRSIYYPELGSALCQVGNPSTNEPALTQFLCPNTYATRRHMVKLFSRILDTYRPDALWFDLQEDIPHICSAPHIHEFNRFGEGYNATQQTIMDTIQQRSLDIFIEMRWPFANLNNKPYTHIWQPIDSPGDFEAMRLRAMIMRPFSAGVVMGTDEMYWPPDTSDEDAARFMAATVFSGVPYFGPNLLKEPPARTEMLKAWIGFYEAHKEDLVDGEFRIYGDRDRPDQWIEGRNSAFIYYGNRYRGPVNLAGSMDRIYVANASALSGIDLIVTGLKAGSYLAEISDLKLENGKTPSTLRLLPRSRLRLDVPVGCLLTITRLE